MITENDKDTDFIKCENCRILIPKDIITISNHTKTSNNEIKCSICGKKLCIFCLREESGYYPVCNKHSILFKEMKKLYSNYQIRHTYEEIKEFIYNKAKRFP